ncbi:glycosyltransferase family 2 protein [Lyngbya confervoides]|uniref:Glycosyltransferase family 2 protein n=1 Tax=Lyngbya confervoides BDU141951 TaxID=1574623 RepID=A0ABD4T3E3_9CYAN|nr:glycosyltransferase family 2 protein [Lyngbya confervoides]MCM1983014.1 glycosyltransferase family 2 protein [Lyngbya confervoides BDU141951]
MFEAIRQAQPAKLLVVADGPRNDAETELCQQARAITKQIDWDCEVLRNYSDVNLGCRKRVSSGLDWAFEQVEEAIVLEDDCLPHPSFFSYCETLLKRYRNDKRIWCISGDNFQHGKGRGKASYYFSNYNHCWGWASWRRAWQQYDHNLTHWPEFRDGQYLQEILDSAEEVDYWHQIFERLHYFGEPNTWDYAWTLTCWLNRGLTVLPNVNLVSNIGFREDGTHVLSDSPWAEMSTCDIGELKHPSFIARDRAADMYTFDHHFGGLAKRKAKRIDVKLKNKISRIINSNNINRAF